MHLSARRPRPAGRSRRLRIAAATLVAGIAGFLAGPASATTAIELWHAMDGANGKKLAELVERFNAEQKDYRVVPTYRGGYDATLEAGLKAGNAAPHILQVFDAGTGTVMASAKNYRPVWQVMKESGERLEAKAFLPGIASYFSDKGGQLLAMPFNSSTAVLYYNKDVFRKAGLDPEKPPKTWRDIQVMTLLIQETQAAPCGYTTDWQSWVHLENLAAWHNEPFATRSNGMDGPDALLNFNTIMMLRHVSLLSSWSKSQLFRYPGRTTQGEALFVSGECAIFTGSSASVGDVRSGAKFAFGVAPLPFYDEFEGAPYTSTIGGAGLFVMNGKKPAEYKGVARFFKFLAKPETQAEWHQATGYLPVSRAAWELSRKQGWYTRMPGAEIGIQQLTQKPTTLNGRGVRLVGFEKIRAILDEELEAVWAQTKAPKDALDAAVERGNEILKRATNRR